MIFKHLPFSSIFPIYLSKGHIIGEWSVKVQLSQTLFHILQVILNFGCRIIANQRIIANTFNCKFLQF